MTRPVERLPMTRSLSRSRGAVLAVTVAALLATAACGNQTSSAAIPAAGAAVSGTSAESASTQPAKVGAPSPAGTYTNLDGQAVDVASLRGTPTVLWFIAAGCSSCTASIPALADHLAELKADGVQVKVIDLYDDLGQGPEAAAALSKLGRGLAGQRFDNPTWQWGISSQELSFRYDQLGEPDIYYVLDRTGKITYQNSVPVSTMDQLLANAHAAATA